jgi:TRAP-type C4-dicarboxylate transport system substrate-binding protein
MVSAAKEATVYERQVVISRDQDNLKKLKDAGMIVNEVDTIPMVKAVKPYVEDFAKKNKLVDVVEQISKMR